MGNLDYKQFSERHRPHIHPPDSILFVTYRLAGSIPRATVRQYKAKKDWLVNQLARINVEACESDSPKMKKRLEDGNRILSRTGQFWEHESFDHVVRQGKFFQTIKYVLNNPVKAGLVKEWRQWRWCHCRDELSDKL
jgi:hypothetical protein